MRSRLRYQDDRDSSITHLLADERTREDHGDVHAGALREEREGGGWVVVRVDRSGHPECFCRWRTLEAVVSSVFREKRGSGGHAPTSRSCRTLRTWRPRFSLRGSLLRAVSLAPRRGARQTRVPIPKLALRGAKKSSKAVQTQLNQTKCPYDSVISEQRSDKVKVRRRCQSESSRAFPGDGFALVPLRQRASLPPQDGL